MVVIKKIFKKCVALLLILATLFTGRECLQYILVDDAGSYTRLMMHEFYNQKDIDNLFIGASHCCCSFVPSIVDNEIEKSNSFNLGSASQLIETTYLLIQEASEEYDVDHIYLEISYNMSLKSIRDQIWDSMVSTYAITDYLNPSLKKYMYLLTECSPETYANSFFAVRRNWESLFESGYVSGVVKKKIAQEYKNYDYVINEQSMYGGKGYVANDVAVSDGSFFWEKNYDSVKVEDIDIKWTETLEEIISYCDKQDIKLTLVSTPVTSFLNVDRENYDLYIQYIESLIKGADVEYWDFNLMKETYFPDTSTYFGDTNHTNKYGAELFTSILAKLISGEISQEDLFYGSMEEKLKHLSEQPAVYGISYEREEKNGENIRKCKIVSNRQMEYQIVIALEDGTTYNIQEFDNNSTFALPDEVTGVCTINYRTEENRGDVYTTSIKF